MRSLMSAGLALLVLCPTARAQVNVSAGGRVETDLYVNPDTPPEALLDGDPATHFCQHRLEDSDWRVWLSGPAVLSRVTFVQGWADWSQALTVRLETADGSTVELALEPGTRDEQTFALGFGAPTAFVDVTVVSAAPSASAEGWGGFAEIRFEGTPTGGDAAPPVISDVTVERASETAAVIRWTTSEPATSQVRYSTEVVSSQVTPPDLALATSHAVTLAAAEPIRGLVELRSADAGGNRAEQRVAAFVTLDTTFVYGVGGWSFHLGDDWVRAPEVFARDGVEAMRFVQAWVGGAGWTDWLGADDVRAMWEAGYTPELIHYYFGDPVLADVLARRAAFLDDIRTLDDVLVESGVGEHVLVTLEPEYNQGEVATWDGWNDLMIEAMEILRSGSGAKVGLLPGDWDIDHVTPISMGRAAAYADFVAFQEMRASTRDERQDAFDVVDRAIRFAHFLSRRFLRPVRWGYAMVSDYGGWTEVQRQVVAELCERRPELEAAGVVAVSWMSYLDSPGAGGYFDEAEAHKGLRDAFDRPKPAFFVWRECVTHGPTWLETGEWPEGGGPAGDAGCGCGTGPGGAGGPGILLLVLLFRVARRRRSGRVRYRLTGGAPPR